MSYRLISSHLMPGWRLLRYSLGLILLPGLTPHGLAESSVVARPAASFDQQANLLWSLFGPRSVPKEDIIGAMPNCKNIDWKKDLDLVLDRTQEKASKTATFVWFYNNHNLTSPTMASYFDELCEKYDGKVINSGDDSFDLNVMAFNMMDTGQMDDRKNKMIVMKDYGLPGHIHDAEFVLFWGHLSKPESVKFTALGEHISHHAIDAGNVQAVQDEFDRVKKWFKMLTHPVQQVVSAFEVAEFLQDSHTGPSVLINKPPQDEVLLREKFYHLTPDVAFAEVDFNKFDMTIDDNTASIFAKLELPVNWLESIRHEEYFLVVKNHVAFLENDPRAYRPSIEGNYNVAAQKVIYSQKDLTRYLTGSNAAELLSKPTTRFDAYRSILESISYRLLSTTYDAEKLFQRNLPVYLVAARTSEDIAPYYNHLLKAADNLRGIASFLVAEAHGTEEQTVAQRLLHHVNIDEHDLPTIRLVVMRDRGMGIWEKDQLYCPNKAILSDPTALTSYVTEYTTGSLKQCVRSESIPEEPRLPGEAEILVGETFHEEVFVKDLEKDLLIDAYAPWCGHCKAFEPQLRLLAELASHIPGETLRIAKIDATQNDLTGLGQLRGYPSILLFPGGNRKAPIEHRGSRAAPDILKWINDHATNKFKVQEIVNQKLGSDQGSGILSRKAQIRAVLDEL